MIDDPMVKVRNVGDQTFVGSYLGQRTVLNPGDDALLMSDAAVNWFGDPRAIDHYEGSELKDDRTNECSRLDTRYGVFPVNPNIDPRTVPVPREEGWPKVEVTSIDGKTTYPMVTNDPEGHNLQPVSETKGDRLGLLAQIEDMRRKVEMMEAEAARAVTPADGDAITDSPSVGRRGKASA